jgi:hypothetical protein
MKRIYVYIFSGAIGDIFYNYLNNYNLMINCVVSIISVGFLWRGKIIFAKFLHLRTKYRLKFFKKTSINYMKIFLECNFENQFFIKGKVNIRVFFLKLHFQIVDLI